MKRSSYLELERATSYVTITQPKPAPGQDPKVDMFAFDRLYDGNAPTKQVFDDKDNIGVLDLKPLHGCDGRKLDGVCHDEVVSLVNGLKQLLARPENKLCEQLQLQLRAALAHLAELYDRNTEPQWLPGVRADIIRALAP